MKKVSISALLTVILITISYLFWTEEVKYALPTPIPVDYKEVTLNDTIDVDKFINAQNGKPVSLHFFNPDCPCSRFNMEHFEELINIYGDEVNFHVVLQVAPSDWQTAVRDFNQKYKLDIPAILDQNGHLAKLCGVYATPQAVVLDRDFRLFFKGNYNKARYCTDTKTNFAQMAIEACVKGQVLPDFDVLATKAYGCQLPKDKVLQSRY